MSVPFFSVISSLAVGSLVVGSVFGDLSSPSKSWSWASSINFSSGLISLEDVNIVRMTVTYCLFVGLMRKHRLGLGLRVQFRTFGLHVSREIFREWVTALVGRRCCYLAH